MKQQPFETVLVTGGAGYVGSVLVPKLLMAGHSVRVLDLYLFGDDVLAEVGSHPRLTQIKGDIRDGGVLSRALSGCDAVIHLACISNDPSFELDPALGKAINYDAFETLVTLAKDKGVRRFIYASSSSVYGIKETENVTEDAAREPLTDYSKYKALCEDYLDTARSPGFVTLTLRPATVCGYSPRQRMDLTVNILTNHAVHTGEIKVFGGEQKRPNIHIQDMCALYLKTLQWEDKQIDGRVYNAGYENHRVMELARMVQSVVGPSVQIKATPSDDHRSYHISSQRILKELGFAPTHTIEDAVRDLCAAFEAGKLPDSMNNPRYFNIKTLQQQRLV